MSGCDKGIIFQIFIFFHGIHYPMNLVEIFDQFELHSGKKVYAKRENVRAFLQHIFSYRWNSSLSCCPIPLTVSGDFQTQS